MEYTVQLKSISLKKHRYVGSIKGEVFQLQTKAIDELKYTVFELLREPTICLLNRGFRMERTEVELKSHVNKYIYSKSLIARPGRSMQFNNFCPRIEF